MAGSRHFRCAPARLTKGCPCMSNSYLLRRRHAKTDSSTAPWARLRRRPSSRQSPSAASSFDGTVVFTKDTHGSDYAATQEGRNLPHSPLHHRHDRLGTRTRPRNDSRSPQRSRVRKALVRIARPRPLACRTKQRRAHRLHRALRSMHRHLRGQQRPHHQGAPAEVPLAVNPSLCAGVTPAAHDAAIATMASCQVQIL